MRRVRRGRGGSMAERHEGKDDDLTTGALALIVVVVIGWASWAFLGDHILSGLRAYRLAQAEILGAVIPADRERTVTLTYQGRRQEAEISWAVAREILKDPARAGVSVVDALGIAADFLAPAARWPALALLALLVLWSIFRAPGARFKTRHGLDSLIRAQARSWPVIGPVAAFNPAQANSRPPAAPVPGHLPPFAESLSPAEFIAFHRIPLNAGVPDGAAAGAAFARQLGPRWDGAEMLPAHRRALFAAMALRGAQRRDSLAKFKSVYSIFVSRGDVYTEQHASELSDQAQGLVGIVNAKQIWAENQQFWSDKGLPLAQEIIFASTGTKKPEDPPWKYVAAFAGSDIQTNPPATNDAVEESGLTFDRQVDKLPPQKVLDEIAAKVDMKKLEDVLMEEGVQKFADPQKTLLKLIAEKRQSLTAAR